MSTYLFIGGPASGKRIHVPDGSDGGPRYIFAVERISAAPLYVTHGYGASESNSQAVYYRQLFTLDGQKRYIFVWEQMRAGDAFDLLVERFPK